MPQVVEMPTTPPITDPANSIENAFAMYTLAVRFYEACGADLIDPTSFGNRNVGILTGDGTDSDEKASITIAAEPYTKEKLVTQAFNLLNAAMGSLASAVFEAAANDCQLRDPNKAPATYSDTEKMIEVIYQIRNGFAHRPHAPNWHVNRPRQRRYVLTVQNIRIDIDLAAKHGHPLKPEDFGGLEGFVAMCKSLYEAVKAARPCPCGSSQKFEACHGA